MNSDGCYTSLDLSGYGTETLNDDVTTTCIHRCHGSDYTYAVMHGYNLCTCVNSTTIRIGSTLEESTLPCGNTTGNDKHTVVDLGRSRFSVQPTDS